MSRRPRHTSYSLALPQPQAERPRVVVLLRGYCPLPLLPLRMTRTSESPPRRLCRNIVQTQ